MSICSVSMRTTSSLLHITMSVTTSSGRLLFFVISILLDFILINAAGLHLKNSKMARDGISSVTKKECSINLYNANGTCTKCPKGTQGKNCSEKCQANMYGELCLEKCDCQPHQECNNIHGCIDTWGICSNKGSPDVICCDNFMLSNGYCKACPSGTFWTNCSLVCPDGYYGMFCKEKCDCKTSECDKAVGCPKKDSPHLPLTTSKITIAAVSLAITSVVIGVTICVVVRFKSRRQSVYIAPVSYLNEGSIGLSRMIENNYSFLIKESPN